MKLTKSGYYRNKGYTTLVDTTSQKRGEMVRLGQWLEDQKQYYMRFKGEDGNSTYDYDIYFSGEEIARVVENCLKQASDNPAVRAQAMAMGTYIRQILHDQQ